MPYSLYVKKLFAQTKPSQGPLRGSSSTSLRHACFEPARAIDYTQVGYAGWPTPLTSMRFLATRNTPASRFVVTHVTISCTSGGMPRLNQPGYLINKVHKV